MRGEARHARAARRARRARARPTGVVESQRELVRARAWFSHAAILRSIEKNFTALASHSMA
jgi:hypothetical protein